VTGSGATVGTVVSVKATVKSTAPMSVPFHGTATVTDATNRVLGTASVGMTGAVTITLAALSGGTYVCKVNYGGDVNHTAASSAAFAIKVVPAATTTVLTASNAIVGGAVKLTATIGSTISKPRTGTVTFKDGTKVLGTVQVSSNAAMLMVPSIAAGSHSFSATYSGDGNFKGSAGALSVTVKSALVKLLGK
jgi:hypothetical protein